jgi:hypothetical protein
MERQLSIVFVCQYRANKITLLLKAILPVDCVGVVENPTAFRDLFETPSCTKSVHAT